MKKIFTTLLVLACFCLSTSPVQDCNTSLATAQLDVNNALANLGHSNAIWEGDYQIPSSPIPVSSLFTGSLWLGGVDPAGNLKVAANTYGYTVANSDFFPGPLNSSDGTVSFETCTNFDRHWTITHLELLDFLADIVDGSIDNEHPAIYSWPGKNNPHSEEFNGFELPDEALAPFVDSNADGIYNPDDEDFPLFKGDKAIWWVFNDAGNIHSSTQGDPIEAEVQIMAYAFNRPDDEAIHNTTFYDFKVINKDIEQIDSLSAALFLDTDLGCYTDDYVGCIPEENLVFAYNADAVDGNNLNCTCPAGINTYCQEIPLFGAKLIKGPNKEVGGEEVGITSFLGYYNTSVNNPPTPGDPGNAQQYYSMMTGSWPDGTPITEGETGYGGDIPTPIMFPDNPSDTSGWSMCQESLEEGDMRMVVSSGGILLNPGEAIDFTYALIWVPGVEHPCPDITPLIEAGQAAEELFNEVTSIEQAFLPEGSVQLFPNPMSKSTNLVVNHPGQLIKDVQLFDAMGRMVQQYTEVQAQSLQIDGDKLQRGIYFYRLTTNKNKIAQGKVIVQ